MNFSIKLTLEELGVSGGDLSLPSETLSVSGVLKPEFSSTEIFAEEVGLLVTGESVYRETAYSVVMPFHDGLVAQIKQSMSTGPLVYCPSYLTGHPLEYLRYHLLVSTV